VSGAANRLTLIDAIVPAEAVTTHTVFCLKTVLPLDAQYVLCALLNSYVANYLIRMRVSSHVTASLMARLRVPVVTAEMPEFDRLQAAARTLATGDCEVETSAAYAALQALAARLYGLSRPDFAHVLETFPLVPRSTRQACLAAFTE
jgi:hypothetical protein